MSELKESTPSTPKPSQQVKERISEASITDSNKADEPTPEEEQPPEGLKVKIPLRLLKRGSKATTSSSKDGATPSKVCKELEANETETTASTGPSEAALWKTRFELYEKDNKRFNLSISIWRRALGNGLQILLGGEYPSFTHVMGKIVNLGLEHLTFGQFQLETMFSKLVKNHTHPFQVFFLHSRENYYII